MRFVHVVLDLDGTLVDTTAAQTVAVNEILSSLGRPHLDSRTVRQIAVHGLRSMLRSALHLTGAALTDVQVTEHLQTLRAGYRAHLLELAVAAPGVDRTLRDLKQAGIALTVLSNKPEDTAVSLLDHVGVAKHIAFLVAGDMGYDRKPEPSGLQELMRAVGSGRDNTLVCGSMRIDMQTARNANVRCAACSPFVDPSEVMALGADYVLQDLAQLLSLCTGRHASARFSS